MATVDEIQFTQGVVYACARLIEVHDQPVLAQDILEESGVDLKFGIECDLMFIRRIEKFKTLPPGME